MRVAMMGAGGIGGYIGARLSEAGEDVSFIARGRHLAALREGGLRVRSPFGDMYLASPRATERPEEIGEVDLVIFAVKAYDGEDAATAIRPLVGPQTRVITFQNGVDSVAMLSRVVPAAQVIGGVVYISAYIEAPGIVVHKGASRTFVGGRGTATVDNFVAACNRRGIEAEALDDVEPVLWEKFVVLSAFSAVTALYGSGIGPILADAASRQFIEQLRDEGAAIAAASGHPMEPGFKERAMSRWTVLPPDTRASMAIDLAAGHRIELDWLSGRMVSLGAALGIPTPGHSTVLAALRQRAGDGAAT